MRKTIQEILFQPTAWKNTIESFSGKREEIKQFISENKDSEIILTGCGTSYYLGLIGAALLTKFTGLKARGVPASEILFYPETIFSDDKKYLLISFSRSGKTYETYTATRYVKESGKGKTMLITCSQGSENEKYSDFTVLCPEAAEETKYMTKSFTSMLLGLQLSISFFTEDKSLEEELLQLPALGQGIIDRYQSSLEKFAADKDFNLYVYLGHGPFYGIATESMLKIKEMACTPSEAFHGMEFMHGPKYSVTDKTLITYLLSEQVYDQEIELLKRIKGVGGYIKIICEKSTPEIVELANEVYEINSGLTDTSYPVLYMLITQLYGYYRALEVGCDLD